MPSSFLAQSSDYTSLNSDYSSSTATLVVAIILSFIFVAAAVLLVIGMWKMFKKAGQPGWAAIVPIYNGYILLKIAGKPGWWLLGFLISPISIIVSIFVGIEVAKKFGKSEAFGAIACGLLGGIGYMILGYSSAQFKDGSGAMPAAPQPAAPTPPTV